MRPGERGRDARMDNRGPSAHCGRMTILLSAEDRQTPRSLRGRANTFAPRGVTSKAGARTSMSACAPRDALRSSLAPSSAVSRPDLVAATREVGEADFDALVAAVIGCPG